MILPAACTYILVLAECTLHSKPYALRTAITPLSSECNRVKDNTFMLFHIFKRKKNFCDFLLSPWMIKPIQNELYT